MQARVRQRRRKPLRPREPSRRDSKEVFEAIVVAATEILAAGGMAELTTNRVAEKAGVGVASVYRYFKDKAAIVAEIDLRNRRQNSRELVAILAEAGPDPEAMVRACLRFFLAAADGRSNVRRALMTEIPLTWIREPALESWQAIAAMGTAAIAERRPDIPRAELERRVFIALHAIQGVVVGQIVFPTTELTLDEAVEQVTRLITPFLLR